VHSHKTNHCGTAKRRASKRYSRLH
jgi:hypothetical protein